MSFSKLAYDSCAYKKSIAESRAVGAYMTDSLSRIETSGFVASPYVRSERVGVAHCEDTALIDVDSELMGLNRQASKCPSPLFEDCKKNVLSDNVNGMFLSSEDTKLSNPPCTLRGTGWNRWEWLCKNPQDSAIVPFATNIDNKLIAKDNHRACIPSPMDGFAAHPNTSQSECMTDSVMEAKPLSSTLQNTPFLHWRPCCEVPLL
jgi:hypothetical protein